MKICSVRIPYFLNFLRFYKNSTTVVPSLHEHKRDLPWLVEGFVKRYCREYGKGTCIIPSDTMGLLMHYDWPGNLVELDTVIQRAVMLSQDNTISADQIILGLPKSEGTMGIQSASNPCHKKISSQCCFSTCSPFYCRTGFTLHGPDVIFWPT